MSQVRSNRVEAEMMADCKLPESIVCGQSNVVITWYGDGPCIGVVIEEYGGETTRHMTESDLKDIIEELRRLKQEM